MSRLPGIELTLAKFFLLRSLFISDDFPTFDLPEKANSSLSDLGICENFPKEV
jgi:hypothetical protein